MARKRKYGAPIGSQVSRELGKRTVTLADISKAIERPKVSKIGVQEEIPKYTPGLSPLTAGQKARWKRIRKWRRGKFKRKEK